MEFHSSRNWHSACFSNLLQRQTTAWWDPASAETLQGFEGGKVRKLACSRSHGCVARAGSSCREESLRCISRWKRGRIRPSPFFLKDEVAEGLSRNGTASVRWSLLLYSVAPDAILWKCQNAISTKCLVFPGLPQRTKSARPIRNLRASFIPT